jgi:hypothetical protein
MNGHLDRAPIFVHASYRGGSTYFFNVLRRMDPLLCFDEAIHDSYSHYSKKMFARRVARGQWNWSHSFLKVFSKAEFVEAWDQVMDVYPPAPAFRDYVPPNGVLSSDLRAYLTALIEYAAAIGKRAAFCEIHSRGRAGALRHAFAGFHVAQFRDPLSQFGSSFRALQEFGAWTFLLIPLQELGPSGENPLYSIIPERWRVPVLLWPANSRAQRWASSEEYLTMIFSSEPGALERVFRWHLLSWFINNLAAIVHSDLALDIDRLYEDIDYHEVVREIIRAEVGIAPDFSDLTKFPRHYRFESVDTARVCAEIIDFISAAEENGTIGAAIAASSKSKPIVPTAAAAKMLHAKMDAALAEMHSTDNLTCVTKREWEDLVKKHRHIWANPRLRSAMRFVYPVALPLVQAARQIGIMQ